MHAYIALYNHTDSALFRAIQIRTDVRSINFISGRIVHLELLLCRTTKTHTHGLDWCDAAFIVPGTGKKNWEPLNFHFAQSSDWPSSFFRHPPIRRLENVNKHISFQLLKTTASWQVKYISWKIKDSIQGLWKAAASFGHYLPPYIA